jgi:5-formyltetrahydrofolate cyclo-ligase
VARRRSFDDSLSAAAAATATAEEKVAAAAVELATAARAADALQTEQVCLLVRPGVGFQQACTALARGVAL